MKRSLSLSQKLKYREGEANQYSNLGVLLEEKGNKSGAIEAWSKARDIYASIEMSDPALKMRRWMEAAK